MSAGRALASRRGRKARWCAGTGALQQQPTRAVSEHADRGAAGPGDHRACLCGQARLPGAHLEHRLATVLGAAVDHHSPRAAADTLIISRQVPVFAQTRDQLGQPRDPLLAGPARSRSIKANERACMLYGSTRRGITLDQSAAANVAWGTPGWPSSDHSTSTCTIPSNRSSSQTSRWWTRRCSISFPASGTAVSGVTVRTSTDM